MTTSHLGINRHRLRSCHPNWNSLTHKSVWKDWFLQAVAGSSGMIVLGEKG